MGLYWDNGKENGNYYNGLYIGVMLGLYWGYIGRMEKKMETTIMGYILRLYRVILGLYWENGKENGNYYNGLYIGVMLGLYWGYIGIMEKKMETTIMGYILG